MFKVLTGEGDGMRGRVRKILVAGALLTLGMVVLPSRAPAVDTPATLSITPASVPPGGTFTLSGTCHVLFGGVAPPTSVNVTGPETATALLPPGGAFSFNFTVPPDVDPGTYTFTVTCLVAAIPTETNEVDLVVTAPPPPLPPPPPPLPIGGGNLDPSFFDLSGPAIPLTRAPTFTG